MAQTEKKLDYTSRENQVWYRILRGIFRVLFTIFWPLKVRGREHVPRTGSAMIVANHISLLDPFVVGFAANRIVCYMAKEELFRTPIIGFLIRQIGAFPVDRARMDAASMRTAITVLKDGKLMGMFPEGTRSTTGDLQAFRAGALRLAARTRVTVIPAAVWGTDRGLPPGKWIRPARVGITFGAPIDMSALYDRNDKGEALEHTLAELRDKIQAMQTG